MDALALLCTLHGDGPATLKRLRRAGCATLEDVDRRDPEELAGLLEVTDSVARRFGREARHLVQRMEGQALDREESGEPGPIATAPGPSNLDRNDRAILSSVLDRWREQDSRELVLPAEPIVAEDEPEVAARAIAPGAVDGLDAELSRALAAEGIGTLEELADADGLLLATAIGQPFSTVRRIQFLGQRAMLDAPNGSDAIPRPAPQQVSIAPRLATEPAETPLGITLARGRVESPPPPIHDAAARPDGPGTVLNWNFDLRPPTAPPVEEQGPSEDHEGSAGPFA